MGTTGLLLGVVLFLLTIGAWLWSRDRREKSGVPEGEIIYADTGTWFPNAQPLYAPAYKLAGKPDYLVQQGDGSIVPVEVKSGRAPADPHEGHVLQLAAYCLLVTVNYGQRPSHGIIQYQDRAFAVDFTIDLEEDLLDLLAEMHEGLFARDVDRDHNDWNRCQRCGMRSVCAQRLA
ncbi:MAG: Dna2/Cas4 domain-containing protein [Chloroflexi bacterium]|nr:Dna2/Cas4 domain-containing protein [Chloroflexota bacterium]